MTKELTLRVRRSEGWATYVVRVAPDAYVLDALEAAARQDSTLLFRHSCHHASCGSCGLRVNGRERLACITKVAEVDRLGRPIVLEPLRNLPLLGDLLVDMQPLMARLESVGLPPLRAREDGGAARALSGSVEEGITRFESCIECGLCVSACPVAGSDPRYQWPATLAAAARLLAEPRGRDPAGVTRLVDGEHGIWRCHGAFECSEVCPAQVDPAAAIMGLRQRVLRGQR